MISVKKGKGLIPAVMAAVILLILAALNISAFSSTETGFSPDWKVIIKFLAATAAAVFVFMIEIKLPDVIRRIFSAVIFLAGPFLCLEMVIVLVGAKRYDTYAYFDNLVFYVVLQYAVFAVTQSVRISLAAELTVSYILHTVNQIVLMIRGTPLVPTDLFAIRTAMTVTTPDQWHFDASLMVGTALFVLLCAVAVKQRLDFPKAWLRVSSAFCAIAVAASVSVYIWNMDYTYYSTSTFDTESTNNLNGVALSFYINARKMKFDPPEGYSQEELKEYLARYEPETLSEDAELPNIIVIMNESFSDLSYLGKLKTDVKYMPYYDKLIQSCPHGRLLVSVLGGGTCNTEFEFLTGLSMMYMPNGCYTYMQHIRQEVPSLASYLGEYGYKTVAMHPFYEICWKRNSVYEFMNFDDFISGEDMTGVKTKYISADRWEKGFGDDVEYVRTLISDEFFYEKVIDQFENKGDDKMFIFGVTVQNHSGYEYDGDDFTADVHITNYSGVYPRAEQYLSLVKKSDEALEKLIKYFEGVDEKTLIVFFGDHQPNIEASLVNQMNPNRNLIVNSFLTRYETPFAIWANYDIGGRKDLGIVSPNFLGMKTLEYAGVPLSREYLMLKDVSEITSAMNTWGYFDRFVTWNDRTDEYKDEVLNIYNFYTYYSLTNKR